MGRKKVKIGDSTLVINEKGQLCELVNLPAKVLRHKGEVFEFDENENIETPVNGLTGKLGEIRFSFNKNSISQKLGW